MLDPLFVAMSSECLAMTESLHAAYYWNQSSPRQQLIDYVWVWSGRHRVRLLCLRYGGLLASAADAIVQQAELITGDPRFHLSAHHAIADILDLLPTIEGDSLCTGQLSKDEAAAFLKAGDEAKLVVYLPEDSDPSTQGRFSPFPDVPRRTPRERIFRDSHEQLPSERGIFWGLEWTEPFNECFNDCFKGVNLEWLHAQASRELCTLITRYTASPADAQCILEDANRTYGYGSYPLSFALGRDAPLSRKQTTSETETLILAVLADVDGQTRMTGQMVADAVRKRFHAPFGEFNSNFRSTLADMAKRGWIANGNRGCSSRGYRILNAGRDALARTPHRDLL